MKNTSEKSRAAKPATGQRVVVTGAKGFVGKNLVPLLRDQGHAVLQLSRSPLKQRDWMSYQEFFDSEQPVDAVIHAAGLAHSQGAAQAEYWQANVRLTRRLLRKARQLRCQRFVYLSSVKAQPERDSNTHSAESSDDAAADFATPWYQSQAIDWYGHSKRLAEQQVLAMQPHMLVWCLRPALMYGPGVKGNIRTLQRALRRRWFPGFPRVANRRSMLDVRDLCELIAQLLHSQRGSGQSHILTDGESYSLPRIEAALRTNKPWLRLPALGLKALAETGEQLQRRLGRPLPVNRVWLQALLGDAHYSTERSKQVLGFEPKRRFEDWLAEEKAAANSSQAASPVENTRDV